MTALDRRPRWYTISAMNANLLFAAASVPAPAGRTSPWAVAVILVLLAGGLALALRCAFVRFRGRGGGAPRH